MLQDTVARGLSDVGFAAPLLVCNEEHRFLVDDQLQQIGIKPQAILLEPRRATPVPRSPPPPCGCWRAIPMR